jgi:DNA-directed RNA polymerase I, II, and III subunit RPABC2
MNYSSDEDEENDYKSDPESDASSLDGVSEPSKKPNNEEDEGELNEFDEAIDSDVNDDDATNENDTETENDDTDMSEYEDDINKYDDDNSMPEQKDASEKKETSKETKKTTKSKKVQIMDVESDEDDDDEENYLQKFNDEISQNYILNNHPECVVHNYHEVLSMCSVIRNDDGIIIDELHKTIPYLTKYERARILGVRAKQINSGATSFIKLEEGMIDGYLIAELELIEKKIPFIIRRPMPNGGSEYWFLKDLENLTF